MTTSHRVWLIVLALAWTPYGIYCFLAPHALAAIAGLTTNTNWGVTELRAMYGGMQTAIGISAMLALFGLVRLDSALFVQLIALGGLGAARLGGALMGSDWSIYTLAAIALEWFGFFALLVVYRKLPNSLG